MRFFNQVNLQTPESVELEYKLAGIGNRAYALVIDYLIMGIIFIVCFSAWGYLSYNFFDELEIFLGSKVNLSLWLIAIQILISFAIYVGYFVFFETLWQGQSPGKRYTKIRVIRDDGRPVTISQSTLRALFRTVDDLFFIGVFLIIFSKQEKRLGDLVAGTLVIQEERGNKSRDFVISEKAQTLARQLRIESDINQLLPEDFATIREYLQRRKAMIPKARLDLSERLANEIKSIIRLDKIPPSVTCDSFLEGVYIAGTSKNI